jgi:hypothetical protein
VDSLKRRNSPKTPTSEKSDAEILPSHYLGGEVEGSFRRGSTPDLFGLAQPQPRAPDRKEAAALIEVLKALRTHPAVAWVERMNSGAVRIGGRFLRFGWPGCPDVLGQLNDGRLLGVEVKGPAGKLRPEQAVFLDRVRAAGGVAFMARDLRDVLRELQSAKDMTP